MARKVHDILTIFVEQASKHIFEPRKRPTKKPSFPVAFVQWGTMEDGYKYELICPFCALTIGEYEGVHANLGQAAAGYMALHRVACTRFGERRFEVEVTKVPLNTEHKPVVN